MHWLAALAELLCVQGYLPLLLLNDHSLIISWSRDGKLILLDMLCVIMIDDDLQALGFIFKMTLARVDPQIGLSR